MREKAGMRVAVGPSNLAKSPATRTEPPALPPPLRERLSARGLPVAIATPVPTVRRHQIHAAPFFTLSKGRGRIRRLRRNSVRGPPVAVSTPASTFRRKLLQAAPIFTLSKGRGRTCPEPAEGFGRLRPKPVRGLPRNHLAPPNPFVVSRTPVRRTRP